MRASIGLLVAALLSATLLLAALPAAADVDPFYRMRLRDGRNASERGDHTAAVRSLRLACFGFLEEPPLLLEGLARLALAQAALGKTGDVQVTFGRIAELEDRFGTYSGGSLPDALRHDFEETIARLVSHETLSVSPAFAGLVSRKAEERLQGLSRGQRRAALEEMLATDAGAPRLELLLAEMDLEDGRPLEALARLDGGAASEPGGRCLRGRALHGAGRSGDAVADLLTCTDSGRDAELAEALLTGWLERGEVATAEAYLAELPEPARSGRSIVKLRRQLEREAAAAPPRAPAQPLPGTPDGGSAAAPPPPPASSSEALSSEERATLDEARRLLGAARSASELQRPWRLARGLADSNPGSPEAQHLAAEIAYRASRWSDAAEYFRRGGDPGEERPELLFFMAVSFFEAGDQAAAARAFRRCLPFIQRTAYVDAYARKILGE